MTSPSNSTHCFHCDLPIPAGVLVNGAIAGEQRAFCCVACRAVASLIDGSGLGQYYRFREATPLARPDTNTDFQAFNQAEIQQEFVRSVDGECEAQLLVEGMHCTACTWLIERFLEQQAGVVTANVNSVSHQCTLRWQPEKINLASLMSAIQALGYQPKPATDSQQQKSLRDENHRALRRLGVAGIGMLQTGMFAVAMYAGAIQDMEQEWRWLFRWLSAVIATPVIFYSAAPFFRGAFNALRMRYLTMDVPVALALALAYGASVWATLNNRGDVYFDSISMFTFLLLLGRYLEMRLRHKNLLSLHNLLSALPRTVTRVNQQGELETIALSQLRVGDWVLVKEGEIVPADGEVISGAASINEAMLTGESRPITKREGDCLIAGSLCEENSLQMRADQLGANTRLSAVQRAMERALHEKSQQGQRSEKLAAWFVGGVLALAAITALIWLSIAPEKALWVTLSVLVVTCPCALSLATPVSLTAALYRLRQLGLLITRAHVVPNLAKIKTVIFDKTGTLTDGEFEVGNITTFQTMSANQALTVAASLEKHCRHPLASAFSGQSNLFSVSNFRSEVGRGIAGDIDGIHYRLGNLAFALALEKQADWQRDYQATREDATQIWLAREAELVAVFEVVDKVRVEAATTIAELQEMNLNVALLSGDTPARVSAVAQALGVTDFVANNGPEAKLANIRQRQAVGESVLMVGDGLNDLPVLAGADVSMAMASATDFTQINADSVLLGDNLRVIPVALRCAKACQRIIRQNWAWALGYNALAIPFAVAGMIPPYLAALGMSASSLVVVLNGLRLTRFQSVETDATSYGKSLPTNTPRVGGYRRSGSATDLGH